MSSPSSVPHADGMGIPIVDLVQSQGGEPGALERGCLPQGGRTQRTSVCGASTHPDASASYDMRQEWPSDHPRVSETIR